MAQIRWDVERVKDVVLRERHWFKLIGRYYTDPIVVKRTFAKADLTGARFEISLALMTSTAASAMAFMSASLMDGTIDNETGWPSLPFITGLAPGGFWTGTFDHYVYHDCDFTTATMTTGDITDSVATIAFLIQVDFLGAQHANLRSIKVMESDGTEKWFASVDASPIEELASDRYQVFNNEDDDVYYSTRAVDYSTFFELGANPNREFRIVNTRGAEITVTELSVLGSEQSVIDGWVSVKNHGDLPIVIGANASTDISVQVLASDAAIGDFFFVLKATWQGG